MSKRQEVAEPYFRPEIAARLRGKIRLAAFNAGKSERAWLTEQLEKVLQKLKPEGVFDCPT